MTPLNILCNNLPKQLVKTIAFVGEAAILRNVLEIFNQSKGIAVAKRVRSASTLWQRTVGLLMTPVLAAGEGLWISPCQSVHTFFMRYAIDVAFLDSSHKVLACQTLVPWRVSSWVRGARGVLEFPAGTLQQSKTVVGDQLVLRKDS